MAGSPSTRWRLPAIAGRPRARDSERDHDAADRRTSPSRSEWHDSSTKTPPSSTASDAAHVEEAAARIPVKVHEILSGRWEGRLPGGGGADDGLGLRVIYRAIRQDLVSVDPTEGLKLRRPRGRRERIAPGARLPPCGRRTEPCGRRVSPPGCAGGSYARCAGNQLRTVPLSAMFVARVGARPLRDRGVALSMAGAMHRAADPFATARDLSDRLGRRRAWGDVVVVLRGAAPGRLTGVPAGS
jgi:hypothetical protein